MCQKCPLKYPFFYANLKYINECILIESSHVDGWSLYNIDIIYTVEKHG